jgi:hypothetical protein
MSAEISDLLLRVLLAAASVAIAATVVRRGIDRRVPERTFRGIPLAAVSRKAAPIRFWVGQAAFAVLAVFAAAVSYFGFR